MPPCAATASITSRMLSLSLLWVMISITARRCRSDIVQRPFRKPSRLRCPERTPRTTGIKRTAGQIPPARPPDLRSVTDPQTKRLEDRSAFPVRGIRQSRRLPRQGNAGYLTNLLVDVPDQFPDVGELPARRTFLVGWGYQRHDRTAAD